MAREDATIGCSFAFARFVQQWAVAGWAAEREFRMESHADSGQRFQDRVDAGRVLAERLGMYRGKDADLRNDVAESCGELLFIS